MRAATALLSNSRVSTQSPVKANSEVNGKAARMAPNHTERLAVSETATTPTAVSSVLTIRRSIAAIS